MTKVHNGRGRLFDLLASVSGRSERVRAGSTIVSFTLLLATALVPLSAQTSGRLLDQPAPPRAGEEWPPFLDLIRRMQGSTTDWPAEFEQVRRWYDPPWCAGDIH